MFLFSKKGISSATAFCMCVLLISSQAFSSDAGMIDISGSHDAQETEMGTGEQAAPVSIEAGEAAHTDNVAMGDISFEDDASNVISDFPGPSEPFVPDTDVSGESSDSQPLELDMVGEDDGSGEESLISLTAAGTEEGIERIRTGWKNTPYGMQYLLPDGTPATGMTDIKGRWFLFDQDGYAALGWTEYEGQQVYAFLDGLLATGIVDIRDRNYIFNDQGFILTGWNNYNGDLYYSDETGAVLNGRFECDGNKYLAMDDGKILSGWIMYGGRTYYQTSIGILTGVCEVDGETFIFGDDGALASGPVMLNGQWYFADSDGHAASGWCEAVGGRVYASVDGALLTGWQEIDGNRYYFSPDGYVTTGIRKIGTECYIFNRDGVLINDMKAGNVISLDSPVSVQYSGVLYEGEIPDPSRITAEYSSGIAFFDDRDLQVSVYGDSWGKPAYGDVTLCVHTVFGNAEITVHAVPVDHVEAQYSSQIADGDAPLIQDIAVTAVYEDGHEKRVRDFSCTLPESVRDGDTAKVISDYGNSTVTFNTGGSGNIYAEYGGSVREGEVPDPSLIRAWVIARNGMRRYISPENITVSGDRVFKNGNVSVTAEGAETECYIRCSRIISITVAGTVREGESLEGRNLIVRYEDGSTGILYAGDYSWEGDSFSIASYGTSTERILYMGRRYDVRVNGTEAAVVNGFGSAFTPWAGTPNAYMSGLQGFDQNPWAFNYTSRTSLGIWTLTAYADTPADQGPYVGKTASGAPLVEGRTVAVSSITMERLGLVFGDRLEINGHVYVIEDHGGSAMSGKNWVDIFVSDPAREYDAAYNTPSEVFLLR